MGTPLSGPVNFSVDCCVEQNDAGSPVGGLAPYVVSLNSLQGIITIGADGGVAVRSEGNTIYIGADGAAGLGTVTSVNATSNNSNLTVAGGPIVATGTFTFDLAGNLDSISGAVMAADTMLYATGVATFATTTLTAFARTLLDDANAAAARTTLGLVIGTNVQAWSADLDSLVTHTTWTGDDVTFLGDLTVNGAFAAQTSATVGTNLSVAGNAGVSGTGSFGGAVTVLSIAGDGSLLTDLNADEITDGTVTVARGGTNISSYATGDLLYASAGTTLSRLAAVASGSYLRSVGAGTAPAWSTLKLPNAATVGDLPYATSANTLTMLAGVATGNALISGGVGTAFSWGKITTSHTTGIAASGNNADITGFTLGVNFVDAVTFQGTVSLAAELIDSGASAGSSGYIFTSTGTGTQWSNQIGLDTLNIASYLTMEGTITPGATTGAQTINKPCGSVNFAIGATSLIVTNSLCANTSIILATVASNDATMFSVQAVPATGSFTLFPNAAPTAITSVRWILINPS